MHDGIMPRTFALVVVDVSVTRIVLVASDRHVRNQVRARWSRNFGTIGWRLVELLRTHNGSYADACYSSARLSQRS